MYNVGVIKLRGADGLAPDPAAAMAWFERAANAGDAKSAFALWSILTQQHQEQQEESADKDAVKERATRMLRVAAGAGHTQALYHMAISLLRQAHAGGMVRIAT